MSAPIRTTMDLYRKKWGPEQRKAFRDYLFDTAVGCNQIVEELKVSAGPESILLEVFKKHEKETFELYQKLTLEENGRENGN